MIVCNLPNIDEQRLRWLRGEGGGPVGHQVAKAKYLARLGVDTVTDWRWCNVFHVHGPTKSAARRPVDVLTIHAVWPTDIYPEHPAFWDQQNAVQTDAIYGAHIIVALSRYTAERCKAISPGADIRMIPQAFDAELWRDVKPDQWRETDTPLAHEWARPWVLWGKAGVSELCDPTPAVELARRAPDAVLVLTAERADVERVAGALPENCYCVGPQPYDAMRRLVTSCDILLATTLESSGQLHLEALYNGIPVLGWRWGGVAETVTNGRQGWLVEPGDCDGLADVLAYVAQRRDAMRTACRDRGAEFTWEKIAPQYKALYEEIA